MRLYAANYVRVDTLSCLWKQNEIADTGRYGTQEFPVSAQNVNRKL